MRAKKDFQFKAKHKNPQGGLSEKGRNAYNAATGSNLKRPQPEGGSRRDSFCARMTGMKKNLTSDKTANDPDSRIYKSLRAWKCLDEKASLGNARSEKEINSLERSAEGIGKSLREKIWASIPEPYR